MSVKVIAGIPGGYQESPYLRYIYVEGLEALPREDPIAERANQLDVIPEFRLLEERIYNDLKAQLADQDIIIIHNVMTVRLNLPFTAALHRLIQENPLKHFVVYVHNAEESVHGQYPLSLVNLSKPRPFNVTYVTVSDYYRSRLARQYGLSPEDITVVNPGIHPYSALSLSRKAMEIFVDNRLGDQDLVLVFPTRVDWNKDVTKAIEITGILNEKGIRTKLVLAAPQVGSFDDFMAKLFEQLQEESEEKKKVFDQLLRPIAEKYVVFVDTARIQEPLLHRQLIMDLIALADFLIFPSWMETFGMPLLEAASVRTGVIASDLPPHQETMRSEVMLFDVHRTPPDIADEVINYMRSDNFPGRKGLQERILQTYTWQDLMVGQFIPLLKEIVDGRPLASLALVNARAGDHEKAFRQVLNILRIAGHVPQKAGEVLDHLDGIEGIVTAHAREMRSYPEYVYEWLEEILKDIQSGQTRGRLSLNDQQTARIKKGMDAVDTLQQDPRHTGAMNQIAHLFSEQGLFPQAERVYLRVMDIDERNTEALNGLGRVYHQQGRDQEAREIYGQILYIDRDNRDARKGLEELRGQDSAQTFSSPVSERSRRTGRQTAWLRQAERWLKSSSAFDVLKGKQRLYLIGTGFGAENNDSRQEILLQGYRIINAASVTQEEKNVRPVPDVDTKLIWGTLGCDNCVGVIGARLRDGLAEQGYVIHQWHKPVWATGGIFQGDPAEHVSRVRREFLEALRVLADRGPAVFVIAYREDVTLPMLYLKEFLGEAVQDTGTKFLFIRRGDVAAVIGTREGYGLMVKDGNRRADIVLPWSEVNAYFTDGAFVFAEFKAGHLAVVDMEASSPMGRPERIGHKSGNRLSPEDSLHKIQKHLGTGDSGKGEGDRLVVEKGVGREPVPGLCRFFVSSPVDLSGFVWMHNRVVRAFKSSRPVALKDLARRLELSMTDLRTMINNLAPVIGEVVDVLDESSHRPSGWAQTLDAVHQAGALHRTDHLLGVSADGRRVAIQLRKENYHRNRQGLFVTGHSRVGEKGLQSVMREMAEEIAVLPLSRKRLYRVNNAFEKIGREDFEGTPGYQGPAFFYRVARGVNREISFLFLYVIRPAEEALLNEGIETSEIGGMRFVPWAELIHEIHENPALYHSSIWQYFLKEDFVDILLAVPFLRLHQAVREQLENIKPVFLASLKRNHFSSSPIASDYRAQVAAKQDMLGALKRDDVESRAMVSSPVPESAKGPREWESE
ncbi:MAG TPA: glycosyltransferase, partial [Candidatus Omnitrophota bacterium]|nr:glycosyltransferase [Candidatus Omnitrophota bacterium]